MFIPFDCEDCKMTRDKSQRRYQVRVKLLNGEELPFSSDYAPLLSPPLTCLAFENGYGEGQVLVPYTSIAYVTYTDSGGK